MNSGFIEWMQVFTIIFSLAGVIYWFKSDLEKDINRLDADVKCQNSRASKLHEMFDERTAQINVRIDQINVRIDQTNKRNDQLYQMFIDLLKETKSAK